MKNRRSYVAFLKGINIGGRIIKMIDLKKAFEAFGYVNVKTYLASGNVVFEASNSLSMEEITKQIETGLEKKFQHRIIIILQSIEKIKELIASNPFKDEAESPQVKQYVTFLKKKSNLSFKIPYESPEKDLKLLTHTNTEICSQITISEEKNTTNLMKILEDELGKNITTRNWNTILKLQRYN